MAESEEIDIERVAELARLALTDDEKASYARQLAEVLHHMNHLREVDVSGIEPTAHAFPLFNVWREDEPQPALPVADALRNAPAQNDNQISVPRVVD